jgi:UDP-2,3-diacylglucosamine pyrophosphatase LpxH
MPEATASSYNYLIISDLHLQEAEKNPAGRLFYFDQEFLEFLQYYRWFREEQRRWKLIIAGDFIEFYHRINEQPRQDDRLLKDVKLTPTDLKFYPGTEWQKSVWKLDRIVRSHQLMFIALARFILEGNEIYILKGNHDLEFFWPQVQDHFRLMVAVFHPAEYTYQDTFVAANTSIHFVPWFYFEKDLLYVEHGHQYDPYCANAHNLYPLLPGNPQQLELALSAFTMRYFVARIQHADPASMENISSVPKYLLRLIRSNLRQLLQMPLYYFEMVTRTMRKVRRVQPELERSLQQMEGRVWDEIRAIYGIPDEALGTLARLARPPVLLSWWETIKCFSLDLLTWGLAILTIGLSLAFRAPTVSSKVAGSAVTLLLLSGLFFIGKWRVFSFNDHRNLREIARTISDTLGCRYVVFGHSHDPDAYPLTEATDQWYFNVGTWVPGGLKGRFVYLEILRDAAIPSVHLLRWDRKRGQPVELDPVNYARGSKERKTMLAKEKREGDA